MYGMHNLLIKPLHMTHIGLDLYPPKSLLALRRGKRNAAVVPSVCAFVHPFVRPCRDHVNTIETEPLSASSSNLADMLTMMRG